MSEAVRELKLRVVYEDQASGPARQFHQQERQRIKDTSREQANADQAYIRAVKLKLKAEADFAKEIERRAKDREREQDRADKAYVRAVNQKLRAEKQLEDDKARAARRAQRDQEKSERDYVRAVMKRIAAEKQLEQEKKRQNEEFRQGLKRMGADALALAGAVAGAIHQLIQASVDSIQQARTHIRGLTDEMEKARQGSRELAALRGGKPTAGFTAQIAREAASVGLSPDEYQKGSLAFEAHAGQFVGEEGATPDQLEKQGKKLSKDQALRLQQKVMGFAVAGRGMEGEDAFKLFGTILAKNKAGESDDKLMTDFAQILKIAELAPGHTSPQIGQIAELGQESVGEGGDIKNLKQAAYIIRVMSQRNPNEASTYGRALFRGLREFKFGEGDKAGEARAALGIRKDTDVFQDLQAIDEALKKEAAAGGNESAMISKYFPEIREFGGIRTAINEGIRNKGFQRAEAEAASVNAATAERATKDYLNSEEGRAQRDRSEEIAAARERSSRYVELRHIQSEVRKAQISSGELEVPEGMIGAYFTKGAASVFGAGSRQEQEERAETGRIIRERLLGSREGRRYMIEHDAGTRLDVGGHVGPLTDAEERTYAERAGRNLFNRTTPEDKLADMANLLKRIADSNERMAREGQGGPIPGGQPPMARGNGPRMGG